MAIHLTILILSLSSFVICIRIFSFLFFVSPFSPQQKQDSVFDYKQSPVRFVLPLVDILLKQGFRKYDRN